MGRLALPRALERLLANSDAHHGGSVALWGSSGGGLRLGALAKSRRRLAAVGAGPLSDSPAKLLEEPHHAYGGAENQSLC
jgi:hypothetical protein